MTVCDDVNSLSLRFTSLEKERKKEKKRKERGKERLFKGN